MAERSFEREVQDLKLGYGDEFRGEGILAVTKGLLQSGVSYVGGYQGAPVSHLLDVMVEAKDLLAELGVHVETCTNEAAAAAMLGRDPIEILHVPIREIWKSSSADTLLRASMEVYNAGIPLTMDRWSWN